MKKVQPKLMTAPVKPSKSVRQHSAGGLVTAIVDAQVKLLLIKNSFDGRWTIPKGHLDPGETSESAAVREIEEETGVRSRVLEFVGKNTYHFRWREATVRKQVDVYLLESLGSTTLDPDKFDPEEKLVADAKWFGVEAAVAAIGYKNLQGLVAKAGKRAEEIYGRA